MRVASSGITNVIGTISCSIQGTFLVWKEGAEGREEAGRGGACVCVCLVWKEGAEGREEAGRGGASGGHTAQVRRATPPAQVRAASCGIEEAIGTTFCAEKSFTVGT
eukprot:68000-Chlamydomonas_euryale.AAC.8